MNDARLGTLTIRDFRSIRGKAVIPLEAPVVLLHGANGAGKSTVMSAIELALTGAVTGIDPVDPAQLVNRGAQRAQIDLVTSEHDVAFKIEGSHISGKPLLESTDARFLAERCYLQQRRLGRLLELYQERDGNDESALTAFVNELLGLDELDALVAGLSPVLHKARVKRLVADYAEVEKEQSQRIESICALEAERRTAERAIAEVRAQLSALMDELEAPAALHGDGEAAAVWLNQVQAVEERALVDLLAARRELVALATRADNLAKRPGASDLAALERAATEARKAADAWRVRNGAPLDALLDELRVHLPGIPAAGGAADPAAVRADALDQVTADIDRLDNALRIDEVARAEAERLERVVGDARGRLDAIGARLAEAPPPTSAEELVNALAALVPHVHSDDCPVCGRDYSELGGEPLGAHLAMRVSKLSKHAEEFQELMKASNAAIADLTQAESERADFIRLHMEPQAKVRAQAARAQLRDAQQRLVQSEPGVAEGAQLLRAQTEAERDLALTRERDGTATELRRTVEAQAAALGQPALASAMPVSTALAALASYVSGRINALEQRAAKRVQGTKAVEAVTEALLSQGRLAVEIAALEQEHQRADEAIAELDRRRKVMRKLRDAAERSRVQIVQRVFTNSLNRAWRELFVRLAPEEPFVPAFRVPEASKHIVATLETIHRDGKAGGPPAAMLSAGNLNTAALTLFLALNLSVECRLPWILLDDPVQSMDELHVAQFAALLRTLTRGHTRRVVIAVHERALFDYLALELTRILH